MQSLYTRIDKTRALLQPTPVEPHERKAAGHEDEEDMPLAFEAWDWSSLLFAVALTLCLWTAGFLLVKALTPCLIAWLEP